MGSYSAWAAWPGVQVMYLAHLLLTMLAAVSLVHHVVPFAAAASTIAARLCSLALVLCLHQAPIALGACKFSLLHEQRARAQAAFAHCVPHCVPSRLG